VPGGARTNARASVIAALACGATVAEAAKQVGINESTIWRWRRQPDFIKEVEGAKADLIATAVGRLSDSAAAAVGTLRELLADTSPPNVRLGAARAILELGTKLRETEELARRISAIEEIVQR